MTTNPSMQPNLTIGPKQEQATTVGAANRPHYFVIGLLLLALPFVYWPQLQSLGRGNIPSPAAIESFNRYVTDLDYWRRTDRETKVASHAYFDLAHDLNQVPLTVGAWHGETVEESNQEVMILLEPEQYVQRLYKRESGEYMWLSMIGGRSSQPFHPPDICYDADGWQYNLGSHPIALDANHSLYGLWLEAEKTDAKGNHLEHIVLYFYLFPNAARNLNDGIVLFKLTSGRHGTVEETLELHADFIRSLFFPDPAVSVPS